MLCIFCLKERTPSLEHIFPLAIGGTITIDRVCSNCNSTLGSRVDAALSDFFPIRMRRASLKLAGNNGTPPAWHEMFLGEAELVGQEANRVRNTFNKTTGKLELRQLYHSADVTTTDGKKVRQITLDAKDKAQIPKIIQRERARHGLPPLSAHELKAAASAYITTTIENPLVKLSLRVSFAYLRHAMIKIAYELAFLWFGEAYLADPLAAELRTAICSTDLSSTDQVISKIGDVENFDILKKYWVTHADHHLAFANTLSNRDLVIYVRIFDIYAAFVVISHDHHQYINYISDQEKLRFLVIDSVSGKTVNTSFNEEVRRLGGAMATYGRPPPFADPLTPS